MSPERGIDRKEEQKNSGERGLVFWKTLNLITMQEAERLGISSEAPVFVSPYTNNKQSCDCGVDFSPITYYQGLISAQHYHGPQDGGIYHYMTEKKHFDEALSLVGPKPNWIAILDPVFFSMDPLELLISRAKNLPNLPITTSEAVELLQFRAFSATNQELKEGFLVTNEIGTNLFPSSTKNHPFITELGFKIIEDGTVQFFNHSSLTPKSF